MKLNINQRFSQTKDVFNSKDVYIKITSRYKKLQFRDKGGTDGGKTLLFQNQENYNQW